MSDIEKGMSGGSLEALYETNKQQLLRFEHAMELEEAGGLFFVTLSSHWKIDTAMTMLKKALPADRESIVINASISDEKYLYRILKNAVDSYRQQQSDPMKLLPVFFITGLTEFLGGNTQEHRDLRVVFNQMRDKVIALAPTSLVFIVTREQMNAFRDSMPDFFQSIKAHIH